ncbi:MAG TPA: hypothetical protein VMK16_07710, partial [Acidimicrobiales bacterium]|nr:hypothetical protein [Acidimicrobiales bacterium]
AIQRQRVLATVDALQRLTTDPDALREAPVPEFKTVDPVPTAEAMGGTPQAPPAPPPPVHAVEEEVATEPEEPEADPDVDEAVEVEADADDVDEAVEVDAPQLELVDADVEDEITGEFPAIVLEDLEVPDDVVDNGGPPTMQVPAAELLDDDDPYIAELRRAIVDPSPLGPREDFEPDDAMADFYSSELEDSRWKGFRRRR